MGDLDRLLPRGEHAASCHLACSQLEEVRDLRQEWRLAAPTLAAQSDHCGYLIVTGIDELAWLVREIAPDLTEVSDGFGDPGMTDVNPAVRHLRGVFEDAVLAPELERRFNSSLDEGIPCGPHYFDFVLRHG
jgi:hypothetical protein